MRAVLRKRRPARYLEHKAQCAVFQWARFLEKQYPEVAFMFAIDNAFGRKVTPAQAGRLKASGVRAGPPDICLPVSIEHIVDGYKSCGLWVEMKAPTGTLSDSQKSYRDFLIDQGYEHVVAHDPREAMDAIKSYLERAAGARNKVLRSEK